VAGQRPRARSRRRARGPDGTGKPDSAARPRPAELPRRRAAHRGHEPRGGRGLPDPQGPGPTRPQREPRRAGTGPEPQRAISPPPAARALTRRARRTAVDLTDSLPTAHAVSRPPAGRDAMSPLRARLNRWLTHDRRVLLLALASGLPGTV